MKVTEEEVKWNAVDKVENTSNMAVSQQKQPNLDPIFCIWPRKQTNPFTLLYTNSTT